MAGRAYSYMILAVIIAFLLSLNTIKVFSLEELSLFLTVIGLIYGLIAAFTIDNAWERFSKIRDAIAEETYALTSVYIYAKQLSDRQAFRWLRNKILSYCKDVPEIEWHEYWKSDKTHKKFRDIISIASRAKFKVEKDSNLFDEITTDLEDASRARASQLVLAQTRISKVQWTLNIFLSGILVTGLVLLNMPSRLLSIFVIATMVAAIIMILLVIYELDSMKYAEEEVSNEPYREVVKYIEADAV